MATKRCEVCGGEFDTVFFRRDDPAHISAGCGTRSICMGCEQTRRDSQKQTPDGRWAKKIDDVIRRHAQRLGVTVKDLEQQFGWAADRMIHEAQHAYANGCAYCTKPFALMGHGLQDLTLDIVNRDQPPYYITNTRWVCQTCNRQKSSSSAKDWSARRAAWELWARLPKFPRQLKLFGET